MEMILRATMQTLERLHFGEKRRYNHNAKEKKDSQAVDDLFLSRTTEASFKLLVSIIGVFFCHPLG